MSESKDPVDRILHEIGNFGKFQCYILIFIGFASAMYGIIQMTFIFTARDIEYRCEIPGCDTYNIEYNPEWLPNAVPFKNNKPSKCERYLNVTSPNNQTCSAKDFNKNIRKTCNKFVYESSEKTIVNEFGLNCDDNLWKRTLVGTINNVGRFISLPISSFVADRYGRRAALVLGMVSCSIIGIAKSLVTGYEAFIALELLESICSGGVYASIFVLGVELVDPKRRALVSCCIGVSYTFGVAFIGLLAWLIQSWRHILQIAYALPLLLLSYFWLTPESVRWLLQKSRNDEAIATLKKAARMNKKTITEESLANLSSLNNSQSTSSTNSALGELLKSATLLLRVVLCSYCWITCGFVFYGLTINSVSISGNVHFDYILTALAEIPGNLAAVLLVNRIGRRRVMLVGYLLTSSTLIGFIFASPDIYWLRLMFYLLGKGGATMTFNTCYVMSTELFPTSIRQSMMSFFGMFARIGSIVAPQSPLLEQVWKHLPSTLFATMAAVASFLCLLLPETANVNLPSTIEEGIQIGKNQAKQIDSVDNVRENGKF